MSQLETLELIESYYRAFNAGNAEGMLALLSDGVAHDINQGSRELGKPKFREFLARMSASYQETLTDLSYSVSLDGSRAAVEYLVLGKYLQADLGLPEAHGQSYRLPGGAFFAIEGGKITRITNYYNLEDWLSQVRGEAP